VKLTGYVTKTQQFSRRDYSYNVFETRGHFRCKKNIKV